MSSGASTDPSVLKTEARARLMVENRRHARAEREEASRRICLRLMERQEWRAAWRVLAFVPLASEPDIRPVLQAALSHGRSLALPRHDAVTGTYRAVEVRSLELDLVPGAFGILEPGPHCHEIATNPLDLILVPGLGFSGCMGRLGRGRGHYDRLLCGVSGVKCGVAFDWQIADEVPMEPHDVRMDAVVTPSRWLSLAGSGGEVE